MTDRRNHDQDLGDLIREREVRRWVEAHRDDAPPVDEDPYEPPRFETLQPTPGLVQDELDGRDGRCFGVDDEPGTWRTPDVDWRWPA